MQALWRERQRYHRLARWLVIFIAILVAFVVGFILRGQTGLMRDLGFPLTSQEAASFQSQSNLANNKSIASRVSSVEDLLETQSLDTIELDQATDTMLSAMMAATGDPYAAYFDPERYNTYIRESADRSYGGIGVLFNDYNGRVYVADVFSGSEAEAKGVEQGDFVETIDGVNARGWSITEVVGALAKKEGQEVVVSWMRPTSLDAQTGDTFSTALVCERYNEVNLTSELVDEVGYVRLRQLTQNSSNLVKEAVESLQNDGARAFVLDLRDNPGGYLTQAVDIASLFLDGGVIVSIQTIDGITAKTSTGATLTSAPLVVLVNDYTASASEVLAGALQDNQRAVVVGQRTQGKGSVQVVRELDFGGAIRYTAAYYLTPQGHEINNVGILPNIQVAQSESGDSQRLVAIDTARSMIP